VNGPVCRSWAVIRCWPAHRGLLGATNRTTGHTKAGASLHRLLEAACAVISAQPRIDDLVRQSVRREPIIGHHKMWLRIAKPGDLRQ
jgi:hypothetical protein